MDILPSEHTYCLFYMGVSVMLIFQPPTSNCIHVYIHISTAKLNTPATVCDFNGNYTSNHSPCK